MTTEFGKLKTFGDALFRLPDREHPLYKQDETTEHLVHFREYVVDGLIPPRILEMDLHDRLVPLSSTDVKEMRGISFELDSKPLAIAGWEYIEEGHLWSQLLPSGDNGYRWWKISEVTPWLNGAPLEFISIEMNERYTGHSEFRCDEFSEFEVGFLRPEELESLTSHLSRYGR